ncbi:hypothetical protein ACFQ7W_00680 [Streptomyces niveus]|uniref:hypothetical protein n=1 Tax=Streptomyces niveus TaxID=193462 RepID=UPI0036A22741
MTDLVFRLVLAALLLAVVTVALAALLVLEECRARRKTARAAERAARPRGLDTWTEPWRWWCCERGFLTRDAWHNRPCAKYDPSKESC